MTISLSNVDKHILEKNEKVPGITSCRVMLAIMGFLGGICVYFMRINMSVAIVCMTIDPQDDRGNFTNTTQRNDSVIPDDQCPNDLGPDESDNTGEFKWSRQLRGTILSSFFMGYVCTQLIGGILARKYGAKWVIWSGFVLATITTFLSPVCARWSPYALIAMRVLNGIGQGAYFPAFNALWTEWAPPFERSKLLTFVLSGNSWGSVLSFALTGLLCEYGFDGGWPSVFYVYGMVACVWGVAWIFLVYNSPAEHPRITDIEREYIETALGKTKEEAVKEAPPVPWISLVTSLPFLAILVCSFCDSFGFYVVLTSLPQYMKDVMKFDIKRNGFYNSLPQVTNFVGTIVAAQIVDTLREKGVFSTTVVRKGSQTIGDVFPTIFLVATGFLNCHQWGVAVAFLCLAVGFDAFVRSGRITNTLDIAPRFSSILMGISNTVSSLTGFITPMAIGNLTPNGTQEEWKTVFFIIGGLYMFGNIFFIVFGSGEVQKWAIEESMQKDDKVVENSIAEHDNIPGKYVYINQSAMQSDQLENTKL